MSARRATIQGRRLGERLAGGLVFPLWARREHPAYAPFRRQIEVSQFWSEAELRRLQQERLAALLRHAAAHCRFYQERMQQAGVHADTPIGSAAWQGMPLLTKRDLQDHGGELEAADIAAAARVRNQTGGSTGSPVQFYVDRTRLGSRMASANRHDAWAGQLPGDWMATVWGAPLDADPMRGWWGRCRNRLLYRTVGLNTSEVTPADWEHFLRRLRRLRPRVLLAYASGAEMLAEQVRERGQDGIRFRGIITSAEVLTAERRRVIESVLGGEVFNRYGCREVSVIASECGAHAGLHVNAEALLVEVVPTPSLPEPWGKVVVTDLLNYSMPLIRYEIGDAARWSGTQCACGRGLPMLAEVHGRTADFLHLPDGRTVSGVALLTLALADLTSARQMQLVQRSGGELRVRVVPGPGYGAEAEAELRRRLEAHLRGAVRLEFEEVTAIASEASGKYRFVVREAGAA